MSRGLPMWISPPFCITAEQLDDLVDRLDRTLHHWEQTMQVGARAASVA